MARRCKDCPDGKIETKPLESKNEKFPDGKKRFVFPRDGKVVLAKNLEEANEIVKAMKEIEIETK